MIFTNKIFLIIIFFISNTFNNVSGQESFLIKKKTIDEKNIIKKNDEKKESIKNNDPEKLKKTVKETDKPDKRKKEKKNDNTSVYEDQFRIVYKPDQRSLNEKALVKVIELSNKLSKKSMVTIRSYASKNQKQGSSDARRLSLSRALEVRRLFIENGLPATNIIVKALGTEENREGFSDIMVIFINK